MNKTLLFFISIKKLNQILEDTEYQKEFQRNIQHLTNSNEEIKSLPQHDREKKISFLQTIRITNIDWLDIAQSLDNIRELIDDKLNRS